MKLPLNWLLSAVSLFVKLLQHNSKKCFNQSAALGKQMDDLSLKRLNLENEGNRSARIADKVKLILE